MNALKAVSLLATLFASTALYAAQATSPLPAAQGKGFTQEGIAKIDGFFADQICLLYTSPSPRDRTRSRMPSSA